jgi:RimJ/RimL family protein N-acetyltransferase
MKHNIHMEGFAYGLRPVELEDAEFIVEVRTPDHSRFMHRINRTIEAQREWLENYFQRSNEYYFVIERKKDRRREGLTGLLNFDDKNRSVEWGRFILRPGSFAAAETALLVLRLVFDTFNLHEVWGIDHAENKRMIAYNESLGFERQGVVTLSLNGKTHDGIKFVLTEDRWRIVEKEVAEIARVVADKF